MHTAITVRAVILDRRDKVLLLRRSPEDRDNPGRTDFPGGNVDEGEDIVAAMRREIFEETGIDVPLEDIKLLFAHSEIAKGRNVCRLIFWVKVNKPDVTLSFEHDKYKWMPLADVPKIFVHHVYSAAVQYGIDNQLFEKQEQLI